MLHELRTLLFPQVRGIRKLIKKFKYRWESLIFLGLGLACLWGCYQAGGFVFKQMLQVDLISDLLVLKSMGFILTFFTYILFFSTLLSIFANHYLAADLALLVSSPVKVSNLFYSRTFSAWAQNSWMVFVFAWPTLAAAGALQQAPLSFYILLTLCLLCLTLWCTGIAAIVALILARFFPARRLQESLVFLVVCAFVYFYVKFNASRPDRFFKADGFKDLFELISSLKDVGQDSGVVAWSARSIFATLPSSGTSMITQGMPRHYGLPLLALISSVTALWVFAGLLANKVYLKGYWLCQEGIGKSGESKLGREKPTYATTISQAFSQREWRLFWRTPSQWTQLLLIGSLCVVYIYNFKYFDALHKTGFFNTASLFVTHIALTAMIMVTLAARFLYPSICAEGKAIWVLQSAPITARELLLSKVRWAFWPLLILSSILSVLCAWLTELSVLWLSFALWSGWLLTLMVLGLSVGMGAINPRFNLPNPQVAAAGIGGISFMLLALLCTGLLISISFPSAWCLMSLQTHLNDGLTWQVSIELAYNQYDLWPLIAWIGANIFTVVVYKLSIKLGAKHLQRALSQELKVEG